MVNGVSIVIYSIMGRKFFQQPCSKNKINDSVDRVLFSCPRFLPQIENE